jgi:hypothetical protein
VPGPGIEPDPDWQGAASPGSLGSIEVAVRLSNGERVLVDRFAELDDARARAEELVRELARDADWPFVAGRYLRPGAVISVDVVETEGPKWSGSSGRAASWRGRSGQL